jgi:rod shape-determining protein MreB and related proteins
VRLSIWSSRPQLAVDLGTANTVVFRRGAGIVLFEPSVVAMDERTGDVHAVGTDARRMIGRTPAHISATRPLRDGVIADVAVTEQMLRHFIRKAAGTARSHADVMVCVPSGITQVERNAVTRAALAAGATNAFLIEEPMAAAIGADLPVAEPVGSLVVDIGGGTTEIGVTALGSLAVVQSIKVGGYQMDDAIVRSLQQRERLLIGQEQAEALKIQIGTATEGAEAESHADVAGRDLGTGLLRRAEVAAADVRSALARPLELIVAATKDVLERTPAELSADLIERGVTLVGGGALLRGVDTLLRAETGLPVTIADSPLTTVALGAGQALEELGNLRPQAGRRKRRRGGAANRSFR